jgi:hypothetical protein
MGMLMQVAVQDIGQRVAGSSPCQAQDICAIWGRFSRSVEARHDAPPRRRALPSRRIDMQPSSEATAGVAGQ